jgi:hypothetical protein
VVGDRAAEFGAVEIANGAAVMDMTDRATDGGAASGGEVDRDSAVYLVDTSALSPHGSDAQDTPDDDSPVAASIDRSARGARDD